MFWGKYKLFFAQFLLDKRLAYAYTVKNIKIFI